MTFYWWSHWFWITLLSNILLDIALVHTYPSQEISLEYNQNIKPLKTVTKLYQATTLTWATSATPSAKLIDITAEKTLLQSVTPDIDVEDDVESSADMTHEDDAEEVEHVDVEEEEEENEDVGEDDDNLSDDFEFKRSVENYNKTNEDEKAEEPEKLGEPKAAAATDTNQQRAASVAIPAETADPAHTASVKLKREEAEMNNYTNFSAVDRATSTNSSSDVNSTAHLNASAAQPKKPPAVAGAIPSPPRIDSAQSTAEWFNAMAQMPAAAHIGDNADSDADASASQKVPFTLENVNKEDELRRAENEHRSRKSKVLSAEYKHINRFINYSADSKSLLTRSASTAPNEFDSDESNISSEALAIQRTYFLDAGAISAICFTVFGVCCTVGTIGIVLYRRRYLNKPQALSEPDSSVYIDDSTMRDNSDEMYSLDNDSFLNSLEAMTIQNYWTDTVKHTKL